MHLPVNQIRTETLNAELLMDTYNLHHESNIKLTYDTLTLKLNQNFHARNVGNFTSEIVSIRT